MNKSELAVKVAEATGTTKTLSHQMVDSMFAQMQEALVAGEKVTISDFGTFSLSVRKAFLGRNPKTGESLEIPERKIPVFRAGKGLKASMNG